MKSASRGGLLAAALCLTLGNPAAAAVERFAVVANGENVGPLTVDVNGRTAAVDYAVSNNDRGPKLRESIELDAGGIPIRWTIDGSSLFGNSVRYAWSGVAEWSSQADKGRVKAQAAPLYIGNDVSPWGLYIYVKAFLTDMARAKDLDFGSARVRATIELMKSEGAALDTTAMTLERLMLSRQGEVPEGDAPYLDHVPIAYQRYRKRTFVPLKTPQDNADYRDGFAKLIETLRALDTNGIQLLPGTDDTTGFSLHRELELYVKAGLSPGKGLRRATLDCERYFGLDHLLGSIERGKLADFILVDGDPTRDISKIRRVRMTMRGGVVYFPSEIYSYLDVRPFTEPPQIRFVDSKE